MQIVTDSGVDLILPQETKSEFGHPHRAPCGYSGWPIVS